MGGRASRYSLLLVLLVAACSGGGGGNEGQSSAAAIVPRFAYVANLGSTGTGGELSAFTVNATTGQLRHNGYFVTASGGGLTSVAVDPSNRFVYTTNTSGVWGFSINATTGALTSLSGSAFTDGGVNPAAIAIDPLGRFAFVANFNGGVSAYTISANGALTPVGAPVAAGTNPAAVSVDPSGRFVYLANLASNNISQFSINGTTGALTPLVPATVSAGGSAPLGIGIEPSGRFLYVANSGTATANVLGFSIGANGTLTPFASGPVSAGSAPRSVSFDPAGRFAYVANQTSADVTVFAIASNGVLSSPISASTQGSQTWTAALDPSGQFAYAVNQGSGDIVMFTVNSANGTLSKTGSFAARFSPGSIAFTRGSSPVSYTPRFAYTANLNSDDISAFRIDAGSGALTSVSAPVSSGGTQPFPVAADPTGRFLYVAHEGSDDVAAFRIDATSGALTGIGTPVPTGGADPDGLTVDPSGRFAYAGNVDGANQFTPANQTISTFAINPTTGALTLSGTPIASGGLQPFSPAVDPSGRFLYTANFASSNVSAFLINASTGVISAVPLQPFALTNAQQPFAVVISPSGRFVYVANRIDSNNPTKGNVSVFAINLVDGSLTQITGSPYLAGVGPRSIAVHPSGRFVYVGNESDSTVTAYQADPLSGVLTLVTGSPFPVGGALRPITVDPSGRFLYAGRTGGAGVSAFAIDTTTGALVTPEIGGAPVPTGDGITTGLSPFGITTTGTIQ